MLMMVGMMRLVVATSDIVMMMLDYEGKHGACDVTVKDNNGVCALEAAKLNQRVGDEGGLPSTIFMRMALMGAFAADEVGAREGP